MPPARTGGVPSPLKLIVHGNHDMEDCSDTGYGWIGEHLASRGMVAISMDENFLNSGYSDLLSSLQGGLDRETDTRDWLLLEHLHQLREWQRASKAPDFPAGVSQKSDTSGNRVTRLPC